MSTSLTLMRKIGPRVRSLLVSKSSIRQATAAASISTRVTFDDTRQNQSQLEWRRWKHAAKQSKDIEHIKEVAHRPEREAAEERRQKKKDRKAKKKKGKGGDVEASASEGAFDDANHGDLDEKDMFGDDDDDDDAEGDNEGDDGDSEPTLPDPDQVKEKMMKIVNRFQDSLKTIRGVEPTPNIFDDVMVNAYGEMTPLVSLGQVIITSPTLAHINCFDPAVSKEVQKAIQLSMSLNPMVEEGGIVKVPLPRVSMETRQAIAKQLGKMAESCRQRVRKHRKKAMDVIKLGKDGKIPGISKDDAFANAKEIDAVTDDVNAAIKKLADDKTASVLKV